jgi:uncharacterized coiled-coil DUF342 family protein
MEPTEIDDCKFDLDESKNIEENYTELFKKPNWDSIQSEFVDVKRAITKLRTLRDKQNEQTKIFIQKRNEGNENSKPLRAKVKQLIQLRNLENNEVKQLKKTREDLNLRIKEIKNRLNEDRSLGEVLPGLQKEQTEIHSQVQERAKDAQLSHENILKTKTELEKALSNSRNYHLSRKKSMKMADVIHSIFVQFMNRKNELTELLNEQRGE